MSVPALGGVLGSNLLPLFLLDVKAPPQRFWCFAGRRWSISSFSKTWFLPAENDLMFCNPGRLPSRLLSQLMRIMHWRNWKKGTVKEMSIHEHCCLYYWNCLIPFDLTVSLYNCFSSLLVFMRCSMLDVLGLCGATFHQVSRTFQGVVYKRPLSLISSGGLHPQKVSVVGCLKSLIEDSGGNFKKAVCKFQSFSNHHHHHHHHPLYYSKRFGQGLVEDYSILMVKTDITIHIHPS